MEFLVLLSSSSIHLVVSDSLRSHGLYSPQNSLGQNTGVDSLSLLQGIFSTQGLIPGLPHCRWILYQLSHKESPRKLEWVAYPFSSGSSWPRNQLSYLKSWKTKLLKCCIQYGSKFGKPSSGHRTGKVSFHPNSKEGEQVSWAKPWEFYIQCWDIIQVKDAFVWLLSQRYFYRAHPNCANLDSCPGSGIEWSSSTFQFWKVFRIPCRMS